MAEYSEHYDLIIIPPGGSLADDDYAFTTRNIKTIDAKLFLGVEGHHHSGGGVDLSDPASGPGLTLVPGGGAIPAGRTIRYKYTFVDSHGQETAASPETTVTTPSPVTNPGAATVTGLYTGGHLLTGNYFYVLTAYKTNINQETLPSGRTYFTFLSGSTGKLTLGLPSLPAGATGFNVYRRSPGSTRFQYLDSVDMSVATPPTVYVDDGTVTEDCNRTVPSVNNTASNNGVVVSMPGATPTIPAGYTWKLYRTYTTGNWDSSLLSWVVTETSEGSGIVIPTYTDVGAGTTVGTPPTVTQLVGSPSKIDLATETTGTLPPGALTGSAQIFFAASGVPVAGNGQYIPMLEWTKSKLVSLRATLSDSHPTSSTISVKLQAYIGATPTWTDIGGTATITAGHWVGAANTTASSTLPAGTPIRMVIVSGDTGATPTAQNLTLTALFHYQNGSTTTPVVL